MVLPVALSLIVVALIIGLTYQPGTLALVAESFQPWYLVAAVVVMIAQVLLGAYRLRYISKRKIRMKGGIQSQIVWDFMSAITPSAVGGAPIAGYFISKQNRIPVGETTSIMLFSMLMDNVWFASAIPLLLMASMFFDVFPEAVGSIGANTLTVYYIGLMLWTCFFAYATLIRPSVLASIVERIVRLRFLRKYQERTKSEITRLKRQALVYRAQPFSFYVGGYLIAASTWVCRYLIVLLLSISVYPALPALEFFFRSIAMWLVALIIPTPGGSGGLEGLYVLFLAPFLPSGFSGPVILVWRLLTYHLVIIVGFFVTMSTLQGLVKDKRNKSKAITT